MSNNIYEITQQLSDKNNIKKDINDASALLSDFFRTRYINKLRSAVNAAQLDAKSNPTRELKLLYALKPFLDSSSQESLEKIIDTIITFNTINTVKNNFVTAQSSSLKQEPLLDSAIKSDGVYEIDEDCIGTSKANISSQAASPNLAFILILILFLKSENNKK